jgi:purine-binding chemotaxis protein CheW
METTTTTHLIIGLLDTQRYALRLAVVERIVRAVAVTPLPRAPEIVHGVVDVEGVVIPVMNIRRRLGLPEKPISPGDRFIVARTQSRPVILVLDTVQAILEIPTEQIMTAEQILPHSRYLEGVVKFSDGMIFIQDLDQFLSLDEEKTLSQALMSA